MSSAQASQIQFLHAPRNSPESPILFEAAWEVCNQVGGIYTVLRTKAPSMVQRWGPNYFLIGPYNPQTAAIEFEIAPPGEAFKRALEPLAARGVNCFFGYWLIPGRPQVILLDFRGRLSDLSEERYFLWKDHGIQFDDSDHEVANAVSFGFCVFRFLEELIVNLPNRKMLCHFHEWLAGVTLPRIAHTRMPVATVFTTHATILGRYMAGDNPMLYQNLNQIDSEAAAKHYNIAPRFGIERAAAHSSTVFSTISDITAREAQHFLGRRADFIVPNGINVQRFTALHEFQNLHAKFKERIHEFVIGHFFPHYHFDLDNTLYLFTSGRYEYRNKGMDVFIEALHRLNHRLRLMESPPTVVAFIITKCRTRHINVSVLQKRMMFDDLRKVCEEAEIGVGAKLLNAAMLSRLPTYDELLPGDFRARIKRAMLAMRREGLPSIVTHDIVDDNRDQVLEHLRHRGLINRQDDPVKIVFHPEFLSATSPLIGLDYDQFVRGCHLGVFPSYYEPWGYTPPECLALGLPTVTTDVSGFGSYVQAHLAAEERAGVTIIDRSSQDVGGSIDELTHALFRFVALSRRERIELRNRAERLSERFDWSILVNNYHDAHDAALDRFFTAR